MVTVITRKYDNSDKKIVHLDRDIYLQPAFTRKGQTKKMKKCRICRRVNQMKNDRITHLLLLY